MKTWIDDIASFLHRIKVEAKPVVSEILEQLEKQAGQLPLDCQIYPELVKLGVAKYREYNTAGGYRVLY
ncbi:hypothetical protein N898_09295 [Salmonella enterica subsp. arizonae serovar 62:z36:- str. RKS2983]|nr:hypothetical protein N898_09295 [Salmonella enterica subsp. arizonae serovar 62:z36:- str. RKS2983]